MRYLSRSGCNHHLFPPAYPNMLAGCSRQTGSRRQPLTVPLNMPPSVRRRPRLPDHGSTLRLKRQQLAHLWTKSGPLRSLPAALPRATAEIAHHDPCEQARVSPRLVAVTRMHRHLARAFSLEREGPSKLPLAAREMFRSLEVQVTSLCLCEGVAFDAPLSIEPEERLRGQTTRCQSARPSRGLGGPP